MLSLNSLRISEREGSERHKTLLEAGNELVRPKSMVSAVLLNARSGFAGTVLSLCAVSLSTYLVVAGLQAQAVMSWFVLQAVF